MCLCVRAVVLVCMCYRVNDMNALSLSTIFLLILLLLLLLLLRLSSSTFVSIFVLTLYPSVLNQIIIIIKNTESKQMNEEKKMKCEKQTNSTLVAAALQHWMHTCIHCVLIFISCYISPSIFFLESHPIQTNL